MTGRKRKVVSNAGHPLVKHRVIKTWLAPEPGNYSQARVVEFETHTMIYTAGQTGNEPKTDTVVNGGIEPQTYQAMMNIKAIMEEAGGTLDDVVKVTVFMKDIANDKAGFEKAYRSFFSGHLPARSLVEVSEIPLVSEDTIVEIEAVGFIARAPKRPAKAIKPKSDTTKDNKRMVRTALGRRTS